VVSSTGLNHLMSLELKNMKRTTPLVLWVRNGYPVRMIRLITSIFGSAPLTEPAATSSGPDSPGVSISSREGGKTTGA